jgi:tRNA-splicing ligase RtcB
MDRMLAGGARWAVAQGYGRAEDLDRIEEGGQMPGAQHDAVSRRARHRQREEMGTLGSGNHYLEVQEVIEIADDAVAKTFGRRGQRHLAEKVGADLIRGRASRNGC